MRTISQEEVAQALRSVASIDPLGRSDECLYTLDTGAPGCVVGQVLSVLGVPRPEHGSPENGSSIFGSPFIDTEVDIKGWLEARGYMFDDEALNLLVESQVLHDLDAQPFGKIAEIMLQKMVVTV